MSDKAAVKEKCKGCQREIEVCAFCEQPGCPAAICYDCQNRELKQTLAHPHAHGG
ncbi:MAG TPA: hypothetical protein VLR46_12365 [Candidatus Dormibacteraeota bacterium]|nr:hypothetical protein [Candidatus Dormibacteraeota bacterium]